MRNWGRDLVKTSFAGRAGDDTYNCTAVPVTGRHRYRCGAGTGTGTVGTSLLPPPTAGLRSTPPTADRPPRLVSSLSQEAQRSTLDGDAMGAECTAMPARATRLCSCWHAPVWNDPEGLHAVYLQLVQTARRTARLRLSMSS